MKYKSVEKYLNKNKKEKKGKRFLYKFFIRLFICILIVLLGLIFLKTNPTASSKVESFLNKYDINVASINNWYQKHFGDIVPFQNIVKENTKLVFNENLVYDERQRELMFEGKRWYDLVRMSRRDGTNTRMVDKVMPKFKENTAALRIRLSAQDALYYPINKDELRANPYLVQNPAYNNESITTTE